MPLARLAGAFDPQSVRTEGRRKEKKKFEAGIMDFVDTLLSQDRMVGIASGGEYLQLL